METLEKEKQILVNQLQCNSCKDIITSYHTHDFKYCKCGKIAVDGGREYLRRVGELTGYTDLSMMDDGKHSTRSKALYWGRGYDKNMKRLPKTEFIAIKDLDTDHIEAILRTVSHISPLYRETMEKELIERKTKKKKSLKKKVVKTVIKKRKK